MKLVTKNTDYAIRAISYLAKNKRPAAVSEMSKALKISGPFLRKILQILNSEGILASRKGKYGGFEIAKPLDKIKLTELIYIFQGPVSLGECLIRKHPCPETANCHLRKNLGRIRTIVEKELNSITLDTLI
jgi:Rrf2 family protein